MNVPVNIPVFEGNEKRYLMDCIDTGWISSAGSYIEKFENGIADMVNKKYGIAVSNGTNALETAVGALDLPKGSEVIMPDFTIISCARAIVKAGLIPVPIDCSMETWNMDVNQIEEKISEKTKAMMVVHIYGLPVDMEPIWQIARKYDLIVIEDAAEAHGLTYKGMQCGGLGDISIFSFFPNKHITCGEGGMVMTSVEKYRDRARKIRNLFFDSERRYIHEEFGDNFRMTNMQAAIGLAQLEQIEKTILRKREIGQLYQNALKDISAIRLPVDKTEYAENIYWVFGIVLNDEDYSVDEIMRLLGEKGIGTRHFFYPMHKQPALLKEECCKKEYLAEELFPNSNYISNHGFYIPSGVGMTREQQEYVVEEIKKLFA